jgi:hypothetical protein
MRFTNALATAIAVALPVAYAQTSTECNPMEKTCPKDTALNSASFESDFASGSSAEASWSVRDQRIEPKMMSETPS